MSKGRKEKMMQQFRLEVFCCCCNLKTGSLIIGTLGWLMTLFQLFYLTGPLKEEHRRYKNSESDIIAEISYGVLSLIVCILMIIGVYKDNKRYILPYLVLKCMECITWTVITFVIFVLFFYVLAILPMIFLFFIIFFVSTLNWYFWVCIWSLYMELPDKGENKNNTQLDVLNSKETELCPIESV